MLSTIAYLTTLADCTVLCERIGGTGEADVVQTHTTVPACRSGRVDTGVRVDCDRARYDSQDPRRNRSVDAIIIALSVIVRRPIIDDRR